MKLSEAIRLGAMISGQCIGKLTKNKRTESCALGSALLATGKCITYNAIQRRWPWLYTTIGLNKCPAGECYNLALPCDGHDVVTHLNDTHRWSRERIADWVATIEPQEDHPAQADQPKVTEAVSV